ncbi:hypothetical protein PtB15_2B923 [Puccinia triticina]|nr:hypothetical protein PtB15_2B923 [Puccinia triticina]
MSENQVQPVPSTPPNLQDTQDNNPDSCLALVPPGPVPAKTTRSQRQIPDDSKIEINGQGEDEFELPLSPGPAKFPKKKPKGSLTQVSRQTGQQVVVDTAQDSDKENKKAKKKGSRKTKDGFDHPRAYFYPQGEGPNQVKIGVL